MSTQELGMFIEREYPYFKRMARHFAYAHYSMGWENDILQQALMEIWAKRNILNNIDDIKGYIIKSIKYSSIACIRDRQYRNHTDIEDHCFHLKAIDTQEEELPDEEWNRRREIESMKRGNDYIGLRPNIKIDEMPFIPSTCFIKQVTQLGYSPHGKKKPYIQVRTMVVIRSKDRKHSKSISFPDKGEAVNYMLAVRALINQNTPPPALTE